MKFYPEDYIVEVVAKFTDLNGAAVTPTAVSAILYDGDDVEVVDFGSLPFDASSGEKTISIPKEFNRLVGSEIRAARILRVSIETDAGTIPRAFSYAIESEQRLVVTENTFLTLEAAEFLALDTPNTTGWTVASEAQKLAALTESYRRLTMIPMRYQVHRPLTGLGSTTGWRSDWNSIAPRELAEEVVIERDVWDEITPEQFANFPTAFKKALRRAQFTEANELLQGDAVSKKHRQGVVTETIGESSVTLRAGAIDYGISSETLKALVGYVYFNNRIRRA
ncbi:hypothetical protein B9J07_27585 [Sinorhizobium sp. LM21]|uniref:hypothetical protein n=1 Tax=Sinorhizobium sp. LM21 TaxID=1449788 RepID=UPI0005D7F04D|nr:hypothetical protein [Sinorhizobium sp. LM21]AJW30241.1 hypothetical protein pLM21S1_p123 [Sinorhizobium sp. LM21]OWZ90354.1 hypothetical protein B9J07_27585 [Sinorhizobium sp. LM21]